jgi:hypothetical protein
MSKDPLDHLTYWKLPNGYMALLDARSSVVDLGDLGLGDGSGRLLFALGAASLDLEWRWEVFRRANDGQVIVQETCADRLGDGGFSAGPDQISAWICPAGFEPTSVDPAALPSTTAITDFVWRGYMSPFPAAFTPPSPGDAPSWTRTPVEGAHAALRCLLQPALAAWAAGSADWFHSPTPPLIDVADVWVAHAASRPDGAARLLFQGVRMAGREIHLVLEIADIGTVTFGPTPQRMKLSGWVRGYDQPAIPGELVCHDVPGWRLRDVSVNVHPRNALGLLRWRWATRTGAGCFEDTAPESPSAVLQRLTSCPTHASTAERATVLTRTNKDTQLVFCEPGDATRALYLDPSHGWPEQPQPHGPVRLPSLGPPAPAETLLDALDAWRRREGWDAGWGLAWYLASVIIDRFNGPAGVVPVVLAHEGLGYYGIRMQLANCSVHKAVGLASTSLGRLTKAGNVETPRGLVEFNVSVLFSDLKIGAERVAIDAFDLMPLCDADHAKCRHAGGAARFALAFRVLAHLALLGGKRVALWNDPQTLSFRPFEDEDFGALGQLGYFEVRGPHPDAPPLIVRGDATTRGYTRVPIDLFAEWQRGQTEGELAWFIATLIGALPAGAAG